MTQALHTSGHDPILPTFRDDRTLPTFHHDPTARSEQFQNLTSQSQKEVKIDNPSTQSVIY